ncbi:MAG: protein-disulfide reductase DsbD [Halieaceae bacterium]|jgi:thiol:disulfide interchange protein DsbD|nr:protein-disulfide reductase DsbD [Halieaceae bacterium]
MRIKPVQPRRRLLPLLALVTLLAGGFIPGLNSNAAAQDGLTSLSDISRLRSDAARLEGRDEPAFLPVEQAYQLALEVTDENSVRLLWRITDGYYLYKKRFSFSAADAAGDIPVRPIFPQGVVREDEYFGVSEVYYEQADITLELAPGHDRVTLVVGSQGCADAGLCYPPQKQRFDIDLAERSIAPVPDAVDRTTEPVAPQSSATASPQPAASLGTLGYMALLAFLGGSILNLMPCVFPVLSLKVFSLASSRDGTGHLHGWVYAAGVVSSFLAVAALLIALQKAGAAVGWGFQLQEPRFVALLAYLFFVMGLSLSGVIELGARFMGVGDRLASCQGYTGSFFTGVLATLVASPCTAPFMGTALGFAVTQSAAVALLVFAALGSGMAAPMLLLSYSRRLRERMPRPGPWMETFKQLLAFPLYATAIWLLWVSGRQTSVTTVALLLCGMLALALGLWLWKWPRWGRAGGAVAILCALLLIPSPLLQSGSGASEAQAGANAWSPERLDTLRAEGRPVFVNVTADWCITCIANERGTLATERVETAMASAGVTYLVADWTDYDADIAAFLAQFGRNGVPLYLLYSGNPSQPPQILPQLLTPSIVLEALARGEPGRG